MVIHRIICIFALTAWPLSAIAQDSSESVPAVCPLIAQLAESLMQSRQNGASLQQGLNVSGDDPLMREIVLSAWEEPRYNGPALRQQVVNDFRDRWHLNCVRAGL